MKNKKLKQAVKDLKNISSKKSNIINDKVRFDLILIANDIEAYLEQCDLPPHDAYYVQRKGRKI